MTNLTTKRPQRPALSAMRSSDPADAAWRRAQLNVDADIEGLPDDPEAQRLLDDMLREGVPVEERANRLKAYFTK